MNKSETDQRWAEEGERAQNERPSNHGQIVRDENPVAAVEVRPPGTHVDEQGNEISPHNRIVNPVHHADPQALPSQPVPGHRVGGPQPSQGARFPGGHSDPRVTPQSQARTNVYRIEASTTNPAGAQPVDPQVSGQTMAQRAHQSGVVRVGGQPVQPAGQGAMPATVQAFAGDVSPQQAAALIQQQNSGMSPPPNQFQGGNASVSAGAGAQPAQGGVQHPAGVAQVLQESSVATIALADEDTMRREMEAAGLQDRMAPRKPAPTTLGRRRTPEELGPAQRLDVTVILSAFSRPQMLSEQIEALRKSTVVPANVVVLTGQGIPGVAEGIRNGAPWVIDAEHQPGTLPHTVYGLPVTPWERFHVAMRMPTKYVAILDDDCIPGPGWLEACVRASEYGLEAIIAAAGHRVTDNGESDGYRGPKFDSQGNVVVSELDEADQAAIIDVGELGWFFPTAWAAAIGQVSALGEPPYGWQIQVSAIPQDDDSPIPTVVLPYAADQWGATKPALSDGLRNMADVDQLRSEVFSFYRDQGWQLCHEMAGSPTALPVPTEPPAVDENAVPEGMPVGTYFSADLERYVEPGDDEWSKAAYERKTGQTWEEPEVTDAPQADTGGASLEGDDGGDAEGDVPADDDSAETEDDDEAETA